jgi:ElaB/YqjD/DUF883 family membrane-anchored ribosome-binding protein
MLGGCRIIYHGSTVIEPNTVQRSVAYGHNLQRSLPSSLTLAVSIALRRAHLPIHAMARVIQNTYQDKIMQPQSPVLETSANGQGVRTKSAIFEAANVVSSRASREFHNFVADIEDLITKTTSLTGEDLQKAREQLNERIASARTYLDEVSESVAQRARKTATVTNKYVHDQPWAAVGIGAAVGVVFGFLLGSRK